MQLKQVLVFARSPAHPAQVCNIESHLTARLLPRRARALQVNHLRFVVFIVFHIHHNEREGKCVPNDTGAGLKNHFGSEHVRAKIFSEVPL